MVGPACRHRVAIWRAGFGLCALAVLALALLPPSIDVPSTGWDKINHVLAFSVLTLLGARAYPRHIKTVLTGLLAYGGLIECLQSLTPYRSAEWADLLADAVGLLVGWGITRLMGRIARSLDS